MRDLSGAKSKELRAQLRNEREHNVQLRRDLALARKRADELVKSTRLERLVEVSAVRNGTYMYAPTVSKIRLVTGWVHQFAVDSYYTPFERLQVRVKVLDDLW
jgi:hypothetical protein